MREADAQRAAGAVGRERLHQARRVVVAEASLDARGFETSRDFLARDVRHVERKDRQPFHVGRASVECYLTSAFGEAAARVLGEFRFIARERGQRAARLRCDFAQVLDGAQPTGQGFVGLRSGFERPIARVARNVLIVGTHEALERRRARVPEGQVRRVAFVRGEEREVDGRRNLERKVGKGLYAVDDDRRAGRFGGARKRGDVVDRARRV